MNARQVITTIVVALVIIFVVGEFQRSSQRRRVERETRETLGRTEIVRKPFAPLVGEIAREFPRTKLQAPARTTTPEAIKKAFAPPCVVVDISGEPNIWLSWCDWPKSLRARAPSEVKTVILLETTRQQVLEYNDRYFTKGYRVDYGVWLVDWPARRIVASALLMGMPPPQTVYRSKFDFSGQEVVGAPYALLDLLRLSPASRVSE